RLRAIATGGVEPALTILLDCSPQEGLQRIADRGGPDRLEREELTFHERVRNGYLRLAKREPARIKVIDAAQGIPIVLKQTMEQIRHVAATDRT
ncbi:MAG: dTMP kinase, partial [Deltaproteobacteria bacterium]|nr:dTMP kinase [Deltaproteobacteria bacterium]